MGNVDARKFRINLETEQPEVAAYLHGYLTGIHDVGWIHRDLPSHDFNYTWEVSIDNKSRISFARMDADSIERDLSNAVRLGLRDLSSEGKEYTIKVVEESCETVSAE